VVDLPKTAWKEFLRTPREPAPSIEEGNRQRKLLFDIRKRAKTCMEDLAFIVENMHNVADPSKQFARIFLDDTYKLMFEKVTQARRAGLLYGQPRLLTLNHILEMRSALSIAGIAYDWDRLANDLSYREELRAELKKKDPKFRVEWRDKPRGLQEVRHV